jgi:hypothetical protein
LSGFQSPVDIANAALQTLRKPTIFSFTDSSEEALQMAAVYDQARLAELRRNYWVFAIRRVMLRPVSNTSQLVVFPPWATGTAYKAGDVVTYSNALWVALSSNTGNQPGVVPAGGQLYWDTYSGPKVADIWNGPIIPPNQNTPGMVEPSTYQVGELVYLVSDGVGTVYRSLVNNNGNNPTTVDQWTDSAMYSTGQVVTSNGVTYQSLVNLNANNEPPSAQWATTITSPEVSNSWEAMSSTTLAPLNVIYPVNTGPINQLTTRNIYVLPSGYLRKAPPDPKAGQYQWLGGPNNNWAPDWVLENGFLISQETYPIMFRFVSDTQNVPGFDPLFAEGLAQRLAMNLAPRLADAESAQLVQADAREAYARCITEARTINGIETGAVYPPESPLITCRV